MPTYNRNTQEYNNNNIITIAFVGFKKSNKDSG